MSTPHLVFVVNTDWFFLSHRLPVAEAALARGFRVTLVANDCGHADEVRAHGIDFVEVAFDRGGVDPRRDAATTLRLARTLRRLRPDIVHLVTPKCVIYGAWAATLAGVRRLVAAVSGLGVAFTDPNSPLARIAENLYRAALVPAARIGTLRVVFQNPDDADLFVALGIVRTRDVVSIRGSGVDLDRFVPAPEPPGTKTVLFASRLLAEKGADVFLTLARRMASRRDVRFLLAGRIDPDNPTSLTEAEIDRARRTGRIEVLGHVDDMPALFAACHVVVFPTRYREGLPKVLAETASCGRPVVTTDVPGCREVVVHGRTGFLVPPGDVPALEATVERLLDDDALRRRMGAEARKLAEHGLGLDAVVRAHLDLYQSLLDAP